MPKILLFLYDDMADFEVTFAVHLLASEKAGKIVPIGYNDTARSMSGIEYKVSAAVKEALGYPDVAGLIIPGGYQCDLRKELTALIRRLDGESKLLAAICAGPQYLARTGVLAGRAFTTSISEWTEEHAKRYGGPDPFPRETYRDQRVVRDGHIITAVGDAFVDFAMELCDYFHLFKDEEERRQFERDIKGT